MKNPPQDQRCFAPKPSIWLLHRPKTQISLIATSQQPSLMERYFADSRSKHGAQEEPPGAGSHVGDTLGYKWTLRVPGISLSSRHSRNSIFSEVRWVTMLWVGDPAGGLLCPSWTVSILSSSLAWCLKPGSLLPWDQLMPILQDDHVCRAWSCLPLVSSHITRPGHRDTANSVLALGMWGCFSFHWCWGWR